jgi:hypothetical protein
MVMESEKLQAALAKVRTSILLDYGELFGSEERCRQRVIDPILSALGWDIFSDEVVVEHPLPSSKGQHPLPSSKGQEGENGTEEEQEGENGTEEEAEKKKKPKRGAPPTLDYVLYEVLPWVKLPRVVIEAKAARGLPQSEIDDLVLKSKGKKAADVLESYPSLLALLGVQYCRGDKDQPSSGGKPSENQGPSPKEKSCPEYILTQTGIPVYEVGRYVMPSRIMITSGVDWIFMDLEGSNNELNELLVCRVEALHILREPLSRTIEVLSRFLSPEAIIGKEEVIRPRCAPVPLRMVVFNPQLQSVLPGRGGNICLYHWESVNDPPKQINKTPITLRKVITGFKDWLERKFPGSKIPYVPKPNQQDAHHVFPGLYEMVIEYWRRFPFNGVTPDTIGVYSNAWGEKIPSCATS